MGLFKKLKQGLGIGTVEVSLDSPQSVAVDAGAIDVTVTIRAESDQTITSVKVALERCFEYQTLVTNTRSDGSTTESWSSHSKVIEVAVIGDESTWTLAAGESVALPFTIVFAPIENAYASAFNMDVWSFLPATYMVGRDLLTEPITYRVHAIVDIDDAMFDKETDNPIAILES